jgi:dihydrofolate reductase
MADYWKTIDTILMGRKTYEVAQRSGHGSYPGTTTFVFSRTLPADSHGAATIVGFPGLRASAKPPQEELAYLTEGLSPL